MLNNEYLDCFEESHSQPTDSIIINNLTIVEKKEKTSFFVHAKCEYKFEHSWYIITDTEQESTKWIKLIEQIISQEIEKNKSPVLLKERGSFYERFDLYLPKSSGYIRKIDKGVSLSMIFLLIFRKIS